MRRNRIIDTGRAEQARREGNPLFVTAGGMGTAMQLEPPFDFDGVTLRVFPLRASLWHLQRFVDRYLNIVPPQVARFRVPAPFVYLQLINYGKMSVDAANLGWISQLELLFCIPLEWYRLEKGEYKFVDWAFVSPFIYVDNELSMFTGREVYGWPKSIAVLDQELNEWMHDPTANPTMATASTYLFPSAYQGMKQEPRTFLEVKRSSNATFSPFPPDMSSPFLPWMAVPEMIRSTASLSRDALDLMTSMGVLRKQPYLGGAAYAAMGRTLARDLSPRNPQLVFNTVNLKQFRSADSPGSVCYQGLTNSRMELTRFKRAGLLGDDRMLLGDLSGGFRVNLSHYASTPIAETLGLEVEREWDGPQARITSHKPVLPFYMEVDMRYNPGETLAWRAERSRGWSVGVGAEEKEYVKGTAAQPRETPYNTAFGAGSQEIQGPFDFPDTTLRVMPLLADPAKLGALLKEYLNVPLAGERMEFEPWGSCVYLVAANHEGVSSDVNDIGCWADRDVTFYVPARWYVIDERGHRQLRSLALVPIYSYANSTTAAITSSEVSGTPVMKASIEDPHGNWLEPSGPSDGTSHPLLRLSTTVLPVLGEGQGAEDRMLLEVSDGLVLPASEADTWRHVAENWGQTLKDEQERLTHKRGANPEQTDAALSLALEVLANGQPINIVTLKQFRDAQLPDNACYQAVVLLQRQIQRVMDMREIESRLHVCIRDYPTQPIVSTLGLVAKYVSYTGNARAYYCEPLRPFWLRVSLREHLGKTVAHRAGSRSWSPDPHVEEKAFAHYFLGEDGEPSTELAGVPRDAADRVYPRRLAAQLDGVIPLGVMAGRRADEHDDDGLSLASAATAIESVEPQMIVSAALSREWENWGQPRWLTEREGLGRRLQEAIRDALPDEMPGKALDFLRGLSLQADVIERESGGTLVSRTARRADLRDALQQKVDLLKKLARVRDDREAAAPPASVVDVILAVAKDRDLTSAALAVIARIKEADAPDASAMPDVRAAFDRVSADAFGDDDARARARARAEALVTAVWKKPADVRDRLRSLLIENVMQSFGERIDAFLQELALCAQKPDYCLQTDTVVGAEQRTLYPRDECWQREDAHWFTGQRSTAVVAQKFREVRQLVRLVGAAGPGGGDGPGAADGSFDDSEAARDLGPIRTVSIWCGDVVDALRVGYDKTTLDKHGGSGGGPEQRHTFSDEDPLVEVVVRYRNYCGARHVASVELFRRSEESDRHTPEKGPDVEVFSATRIASDPDAQIGAFVGEVTVHSDGMAALSRLDVVVIVPDF